MKTGSKLALLDTNVLVYAYYDQSEHFDAARALLLQAEHESAELCVTPKTLAEFYATVTNPRRVTKPQPAEVISEAVTQILALPGISLLPMPVDVVKRWIDLIRKHPVTGQDIFDVQLVATMLGNAVTRLYTFNVQDFQAFSEIEVLRPEAAKECL